MASFRTIVIVCCVVVVALDLLFVIRNAWVYQQGMKILNRDGLREFDRLPSYGVMVCRFWVWDVRKFLR